MVDNAIWQPVLPELDGAAVDRLAALVAAEAAAGLTAAVVTGGGNPAPAAAAVAAATGVKPEDVMATLEKLGELKSKGILTQEEFDAKKAELLKKLV